MTSFRGDRTIDGIVVTVDGRALDPRRDLKSYSKNYYEWGYEGVEPTQLAFAILVQHLNDPARAESLADAFMKEVVANFGNEWEMSGAEIDEALEAMGAAGAAPDKKS